MDYNELHHRFLEMEATVQSLKNQKEPKMSNDHPDYENHPLRFFMPFSENERFLNRFQELEAEIQSLKNQLANRDAQMPEVKDSEEDDLAIQALQRLSEQNYDLRQSITAKNAQIEKLKNQVAGVIPSSQDFDDLRTERNELRTLLARYLRVS